MDQRRRFNKSERSALFRLAEGRCSACAAELTHGWHADHIDPHSQGGPTDVINGQALCPTCNRKKGDRMPVQPRSWQKLFIAKYTGNQPTDFLLVACPGAGKTLAAAMVVRDLLNDGYIDRVLVVVPSATLREQWRKALALVGVCVDSDTANNQNGEMVTVLGRATQGWVVTYQALAAQPLDHRAINGRRRTLAILDEVHHLSTAEGKSWGKAAQDALEPCVRRLVLSGTPFRGDNAPIPFVEYEPTSDGGQQCRYRDASDGTPYPFGFDYSYGVALADDPSPVRPVVFDHFDGDVEWMDWDAKKVQRVRVSDDITNKQTRSRANKHVLNPAGEWLTSVLRAADDRLRMVREQGDPRAKGLVICYDLKHADAVAERLRGIAGETVYTAFSKDEFGCDTSEEARRVIENFGTGPGKWLVAVRLVTEGVDIPELRVGVYATTVRTPLYFRQVVGRVVRRRDDMADEVDQTAYLFVPQEPAMLELANAVQEEITLSLIEQSEESSSDERESSDGSGNQDGLPFDPFRESTADDSGILVPGRGVVASETAHRISRDTGQPVGVVATILAAASAAGFVAGEAPPPQESQEKPRDQLKRRRNLLEKLIQQYVGVLMQNGQGRTKNGVQDYGLTISVFKSQVYEHFGIYQPGMTKNEKKHAYTRADLPIIDSAIGYITKILAER